MAGNLDGGLDSFDPRSGAVTQYLPDPDDPRKLSGDGIRSILEDVTGALWIGTTSGFNRLDKDRKNFVRYQHISTDERSLSSNIVRALIEDSSARLWVGTEHGLDMWQPEELILAKK